MLPPDAPLTLEWEPGDPVPPGYSVHNVQQTGMLIAGGAVLAVAYGITFLYGYTAQIENSLECGFGDEAKCDREYWPLLVPIVGPFAGFGTTKPTGAGVAALLVSGITQTAGAGLFIGGLVLEEKLLIRNDRRWGVVPVLEPRRAGLALSGSW